MLMVEYAVMKDIDLWKTLRSPSVIIGIVVLLLIPFAVVFQNGGMPGMPKGSAGTVFGKNIPLSSFEEHMRWNLLWREASLPKGISDEEVSRIASQEAWDRLALLEEAKRENVSVGDHELADFIRAMALFQRDNRFDPNRYHTVVTGLGMTPQRFERLLRQSLQIEKLVKNVRESATVSDQQVREAYEKAHAKVRLAYALIGTDPFFDAASKEVTDEQMQTFYDAHPDSFRNPERLTFDAVGQPRDAFAPSATVTDAEIDEAIAETAPPAETASEPKPPAPDRAAIRDQILQKKIDKQLTDFGLELQQRLDEKKDVDVIASELNLPKRTVGPLAIGETWDGTIDPMIILTAYGLAEGETSQVIEGTGKYVVQMRKRDPATVRPFEEVKDAIRTELTHQKASEAARKKAETLQPELAKRLQEGKSFEEAAAEQSLTVSTADPVGRGESISSLPDARPVIEAAFGTEANALGGPITVPSGSVLFVVREKIPADPAGFESEREKLQTEMLEKTRNDHLSAWLMDLRSRADIKSAFGPKSSPPNAPATP